MTHAFLDIETLGTRPGCTVIQLAAMTFDPVTGEAAGGLSLPIAPGEDALAELATLRWAQEHGTWPRKPGEWEATPAEAADALARWAAERGTVDVWWAWGASFDFPMLDAMFRAVGRPAPWKYWQCRCARTAWQLAFGDAIRPPRSHDALEDVRAGIADLCMALSYLKTETFSPEP